MFVVSVVQELHMTGCAVVSYDMALIIAEGGEKAQKRYNKLMLRRIDWDKDREDVEGEAGCGSLTLSPLSRWPCWDRISSV